MGLRLFHGGTGLDKTLSEIKPSKRNRAEFGAGLYLSNNIERALDYAKGSRRLYEVEVDLSQAQNLRDTYAPQAELDEWVENNISDKNKKRLVMHDLFLREDANIAAGYASLNVLNNLMINHEALTPKNSVSFNRFLQEWGVDYALDTFGGVKNEQVLVVINPSIIKDIKPKSRSSITQDDYEIHRIEPVMTRPRFDVVSNHIIRLLRIFEAQTGEVGALHYDNDSLIFMDDACVLERYQLQEDGLISADENEQAKYLLESTADQWDNEVGNWKGSTEPHVIDFKALADRIKPLGSYYDAQDSKPKSPAPTF